MKIAMLPDLKMGGGQSNGISRVVEAYYKYLPRFGVSFVDDDSQDLKVVHAGITGAMCDVAILHGLYFTEDYDASGYEYRSNQSIVDAVRAARKITVPSDWVAEIIRRDMRVNPAIVPHGIEWDEWQHDYENAGYVLYNKNRDGMDVCNSIHLGELALRRKEIPFISTYSKLLLPNIKITGTVPFEQMKPMVQQAAVYLSLTKETFGIGTLEALASGVPVLGFRYGGNVDTVEHGVTGYLANPKDYDDLAFGLDYCLKYRDTLGANAREASKKWTWEKSVQGLYNVLVSALNVDRPTVSVIIPTYNYADKVGNAIISCIHQERKPDEIIVVDDGSTDDTEGIVRRIISANPESNIFYYKIQNGGVAVARNFGFLHSTSKYICCLDADDQIAPQFLSRCVQYLEDHKGVSLVYTSLLIRKDGKEWTSQWPETFNYDAQLRHHNQIPTCNVATREMWQRLGGQRQRYAPMGMGAEDADMWTRMGAYGMQAVKITEEPLFIYNNTGRTKDGNYQEVDWLQWHPWVKDNRHPFASLATPARMSHPVRQYDNPSISVIIPVGPGHENQIVNALDSLDAQTFRGWEAIVVWDSPDPVPDMVMNAYPYIRLFKTEKPKSGPGIARNLGAKKARGILLMFLDADDWLSPGESLQRMYNEWMISDSIIYTDYFGVSYIDESNIKQFSDRLVSYNYRNHESLTRHKSAEYDCARAQTQPVNPLYHWCLVTCLIPKRFHDKIGGFDEKMKSWEDVDYHWRMAHEGICYTHITEPYVVYQFATGTRRELASAYSNKETGIELIDYMHEKYKGVTMSPCPGGCGGSRSNQYTQLEVKMPGMDNKVADDDLVMVKLNDGNLGDHAVIGAITRTNYGYRASGDVFLMRRNDVNSMPNIYTIIGSALDTSKQIQTETPPPPVRDDLMAITPKIDKPTQPVVAAPVAPVATIEPETNKEDVFDPQSIPGVSFNIAKQIIAKGIRSAHELKEFGKEGLLSLEGVGDKRADIIIKALEND